MKIYNSLKGLILAIAILVIGQMAALLLSNLIVFLKLPESVGYIVFACIYIFCVYVLGKLLCEKVLNISLDECRINKHKIPMIWIVCSIILPVMVSAILLLTSGEMATNPMSMSEKVNLICLAVFFYGFGSGFAEEMIFRGIIMKVLEKYFGKTVAILFPSVIFGLLHATGGMNLKDILMLFIAGTSVGIMFSLIVYASGTVWSSAIVHAVWNIIMIGEVLNISTEHMTDTFYSYKLASKSILITGGEFGVEASGIAIAGYNPYRITCLVYR